VPWSPACPRGSASGRPCPGPRRVYDECRQAHRRRDRGCYASEGAVLPPGTILHVTVSFQGSAAVASETVRSGAKYRFSVPPGVYQVIGWWGSRRVIVRAGHVVTANFMNTCI
jgi:hypothetical protein